jgi:hypothetical protein
MEDLFVESGHASVNKHDETLCGDSYSIIRNKDKTTIVLSDGLGSGVKANILSTLTATMLSTMVSRKLPIDECVETVASTLPMCKVRHLSYSTFTVLEIEGNRARLVQYDNPPAIFIRNGKRYRYPTSVHFVGEKEIHESNILLQEGDIIVLMSDGVTNAGVGKLRPDGWEDEGITAFIEEWSQKENSAKRLAGIIGNACMSLSMDSPDDDITTLVFTVRRRQAVNVMIGPPGKKEDDPKVFKLFFAKEGKHVVCGGSTAHAVSRYLNKPLVLIPESGTETIPAIAAMAGVDLVTEGVLTLQKVVEIAKRYAENNLESININQNKDGASLIAEMLFEQATDINIFFGTAVNQAHDSLDIGSSTKLALVKTLAQCLTDMGKNVKLSMC